jgi:hypothetical protein
MKHDQIRSVPRSKHTQSLFRRFMPSNTTRQFIITTTLYEQHVSAILISHHQALHSKTHEQNT